MNVAWERKRARLRLYKACVLGAGHVFETFAASGKRRTERCAKCGSIRFVEERQGGTYTRTEITRDES